MISFSTIIVIQTFCCFLDTFILVETSLLSNEGLDKSGAIFMIGNGLFNHQKVGVYFV